MVIFHSYVKLPEGIQNHQFDGENDDPSQDSGIPYVQINIDLLSLWITWKGPKYADISIVVTRRP